MRKMFKSKECEIDEKTKQMAKNLVNNAKNMGKIKSHTEAFKKYPVENEIHKGNEKYFLN